MKMHDEQWHRHIYLTPRWVCTVCECKPDVYSSSKARYLHLKESHGDRLKNAQLQAFTRHGVIEVPRTWDECLLCCSSVKERPLRGKAAVSKPQKAQLKLGATETTRRTLQMTNPDDHVPDPSSSDTSCDSENEESNRDRQPGARRSYRATARHIAAHLQVLMLLTLRLADLQNDGGDVDEDVDGDSVITERRSRYFGVQPSRRRFRHHVTGHGDCGTCRGHGQRRRRGRYASP